MDRIATAELEHLRQRILALVAEYAKRPDVTLQSILLLNCIAGDIRVMGLK
jgi:hypothetical protein